MTLKYLRICLYKDLPEEKDRDINYFYFTYDKLILYKGKTRYYDQFIVCDIIPKNPIINCLYIELKTGYIRSLIGDEIQDVAKVEDQSQMSHIRDIGTTYLMNTDRVYIDEGSRTLQLPYYNGKYNMSVSMANDLKLDEKTIVRYDKNSESFYLEGEHQGITNFKPYTGHDTDSVSVTVEEHTIIPEVRVSRAPNNMIKVLRGGLYVGIDNKANVEDFEALKIQYEKDKLKLNRVVPALIDLVDDLQDSINPNSILSMIISATTRYVNELKDYTDRMFNKKINEMQDVLNESVWGNF